MGRLKGGGAKILKERDLRGGPPAKGHLRGLLLGGRISYTGKKEAWGGKVYDEHDGLAEEGSCLSGKKVWNRKETE